jgi:hypothetical protein
LPGAELRPSYLSAGALAEALVDDLVDFTVIVVAEKLFLVCEIYDHGMVRLGQSASRRERQADRTFPTARDLLEQSFEFDTRLRKDGTRRSPVEVVTIEAAPEGRGFLDSAVDRSRC